MNSITVAPFLFSLRRFFLVGQTPWSARDAPVPPFLGTEGLPDPNGPTWGSAGSRYPLQGYDAFRRQSSLKTNGRSLLQPCRCLLCFWRRRRRPMADMPRNTNAIDPGSGTGSVLN